MRRQVRRRRELYTHLPHSLALLTVFGNAMTCRWSYRELFERRASTAFRDITILPREFPVNKPLSSSARKQAVKPSYQRPHSASTPSRTMRRREDPLPTPWTASQSESRIPEDPQSTSGKPICKRLRSAPFLSQHSHRRCAFWDQSALTQIRSLAQGRRLYSELNQNCDCHDPSVCSLCSEHERRVKR
jgi:hypothetical protein